MTEANDTNAEELRRAAKTLRTRADQATYGAFVGNQIFLDVRDQWGDPAPTDEGDVKWIKTLSPAIADPLADLLAAFIPRAEAIAEKGSPGYQGLEQFYHALDTARFINAQQEDS